MRTGCRKKLSGAAGEGSGIDVYTLLGHARLDSGGGMRMRVRRIGVLALALVGIATPGWARQEPDSCQYVAVTDGCSKVLRILDDSTAENGSAIVTEVIRSKRKYAADDYKLLISRMLNTLNI